MSYERLDPKNKINHCNEHNALRNVLNVWCTKTYLITGVTMYFLPVLNGESILTLSR